MSLNPGQELKDPANQPPAPFVIHADFAKHFMPWEQAFRFHPNVTGAVTNATNTELIADITTPHPLSREGVPMSPRSTPRVKRDPTTGVVTEIDTSSRTNPYKKRLAEQWADSTRALARRALGLKHDHHHHNKNYHIPKTLPFNMDNYRELFRQDKLMELTRSIDRRIEEARTSQDLQSLLQDEVEAIRTEELQKYAGDRATPELLNELGKWQRYVTAQVRNEGRAAALAEVFAQRQRTARQEAEERQREIEAREAETTARREETKAAKTRHTEHMEALNNLTAEVRRVTTSQQDISKKLTEYLAALGLAHNKATSGTKKAASAEQEPTETLTQHRDALRSIVVQAGNEHSMSEDWMVDALQANGIAEEQAHGMAQQFLAELASQGVLIPTADGSYNFAPGINRKTLLERFRLGSTKIDFSS